MEFVKIKTREGFHILRKEGILRIEPFDSREDYFKSKVYLINSDTYLNSTQSELDIMELLNNGEQLIKKATKL